MARSPSPRAACSSTTAPRARTISANGTQNTIGAIPTVLATTTVTNALVNLTTGTTAGFYVGMPVLGNPNIPAGETVASIQSPTQFTLSSATGVAAATSIATNPGETIIIVNGSAAPANALTINASIGSFGGSLTKAGNGMLIIGGSNGYTGNTTINQGVVQLSGPSASLGSITTAGNITTLRQGATLDLNGAGPGGQVTIGALQGAGTITNSSAGISYLNIGFYGATTSAGVFSGLLQDGTGTLYVTKNSTGRGIAHRGEHVHGRHHRRQRRPRGELAQRHRAAEQHRPRRRHQRRDERGQPRARHRQRHRHPAIHRAPTRRSIRLTQTPTISINRLFSLGGNGAIDSSGQFGNNVLAVGTQNNAALVFRNPGTLGFTTGGSKTLDRLPATRRVTTSSTSACATTPMAPRST